MTVAEDPAIEPLADRAVRQRALEPLQSFIVQAPAGSGKTELLILRFLALLARVDEPEEILAITYTRAATAEMRSRLLEALAAAETGEWSGLRPETYELALAACRQAHRRGWNLLEQPTRLNVTTIDALSLRIAHADPLVAGLGGGVPPTEDADPLYRAAARSTLEQLGGADPALSEALETLLTLRDANLSNCEDLLADMLQRRDQWLDLLPPARATEAEWERVRARLEAPLQRACQSAIRRVQQIFTRHPEATDGLLRFARYACRSNRLPELAPVGSAQSIAELTSLHHWRSVCDFVLTQSGETFRRTFNETQGFPSRAKGGCQATKEAAIQWLQDLASIAGLRDALCGIRKLPPQRYSEQQWLLVRRIITVLRHSAHQLRRVFAQQGAVDFAEVGMAALQALRRPECAAAWGGGIRHLLVDEFQDTSRSQFRLLTALIGSWRPGDRRTCFIVGDPMQSIYLFREAEVALFGKAQREGIAGWTLEPLRLTMNFRSIPGMVEPLNAMFSAVFGAAAEEASIPFSPSVSGVAGATENAVRVLPDFPSLHAASARQIGGCARREAERVLEIIRRHLPAIDRAEREGRRFSVGVLVRASNHLGLLASELRRAGIPFRASGVEQLSDRPEILDLQSLLRALTHPMDRIAWLSVLRAPWCGLSLRDLHALCGDELERGSDAPILSLLAERLDRLSDAGRASATRVRDAMSAALERRAREWFAASPAGLALWLQQTWEALGGPACLDAEARENALLFLRMLATLPPDGRSVRDGELDRQLQRLHAQPDPRTRDRHGVQLMTIHKSKGLDFDVVIVPSLDRRTSTDKPPLLAWMHRECPESGEPELLLAAIGPKDAEPDGLHRWVQKQRSRQLLEEQQRLLYVACTRARSELHLLGAVQAAGSHADSDGLKPPSPRTLLGTGWPYLRMQIEEAWVAAHRRPAPSAAAVLPFPELDAPSAAHAGVVSRLAAHASQPSSGPAAEAPIQRLRRLPPDWCWTAPSPGLPARHPANGGHTTGEETARRRAGSRESRVRGVILHALLEQASKHLAAHPQYVYDAEVWSAIAAALLRQHALPREAQRALLADALSALQRALQDPAGRWLLSARAEARSEGAWSQPARAGGVETLRPDRIFLAGPEPGRPGQDYLWIVDYKTSAPNTRVDLAAFLTTERQQHAPQLARYSRLLREVYGENRPQRMGLYYPRLPALDWFAVD